MFSQLSGLKSVLVDSRARILRLQSLNAGLRAFSAAPREPAILPLDSASAVSIISFSDPQLCGQSTRVSVLRRIMFQPCFHRRNVLPHTGQWLSRLRFAAPDVAWPTVGLEHFQCFFVMRVMVFPRPWHTAQSDIQPGEEYHPSVPEVVAP